MKRSLLPSLPLDLLQGALDNPYEGTVIVDSQGIVRHFSKVNEVVYGVSSREAIGQHISAIVPNTGLPQVLKTGKAQIGKIFDASGRQVIVSRYPIKKDGKIIGAMGKVVFHDMQAVVELKKKIMALQKSVKHYRQSIREAHQAHYCFDDIKGTSPRLLQVKELAGRVATSDSPILLLGESGTGKELFAHAIHLASPRREHPFVRVNCGSIPLDLFESELFGYESGAFTGAAKSGKPGKFELADLGTIFLDEVSELPLAMQVKLLRVLQEREVERLGARDSRFVDFRLIAATNQDLSRLVQSGYFRKDLYYRINVIAIRLPPLREMREDIPVFLHHFLDKLQRNTVSKVRAIAPEVLDVFMCYEWPGNVRELENVVAHALSLTKEDQITLEHLPENLAGNQNPGLGGEHRQTGLERAVRNAEKARILDALQRAKGNKVKAAQLLNIHRTTLYYKLKKYGIDLRKIMF